MWTLGKYVVRIGGGWKLDHIQWCSLGLAVLNVWVLLPVLESHYKRPFVRPVFIWEDSIKMDLRMIGCKNGDEPAVHNKSFLMSIIIML